MVDTRVARLALWGGDDDGAHHTAALLMPMTVDREGVERPRTGASMLDDLEWMIASVCRYLHQREPDLDELSMIQLRSRYDKAISLVKAELGVKNPFNREAVE